MMRRSGRAPKLWSYPRVDNSSIASSVTSSVMFCSLSWLRTRVSIRLAIWRMWAVLSEWNTITASSRFRNSGRKDFFSSCSTLSFMTAYSRAAVFSSSERTVKPSVTSRLMMSAPTLEVMMMMVLRKSTLRPLASDRLPSSMICSSMLKASGWAFSISSKRITE